MVICVRNFRVSTVIIIPLIFLLVKPTKCQKSATDTITRTEDPAEVVTEEVEKIRTISGDQNYFFETGLRPRTPAPAEGADAGEQGGEGDDYNGDNSPTYENESYEEFYDDNEDEDACKERTYGRFLLIGSGVLLVLGLCGIVCFTKKKDEGGNSMPSVTTCFRACKIEDDHDDSCVVNFMNAPSPDLSDSESDYQNIPLPLIYEDMGKICNNAEMFIQRCMTSSVKRTYSEPVKTLTSSRTKFRDYIKELAYLKERQNQECTKHGAVRAFFEEMFKMFRRSELPDRRKRYSAENSIKTAQDTRVKIEDSTKNVLVSRKVAKPNKPSKNKQRKSSSSISITSLLLKPQYQCKYYKPGNAIDKFRSRKRNNEKERRGKGDNKSDGENLPLMINQKKTPQNIEVRRSEYPQEHRKHKVRSQDTEELIRMCVKTMRQPFNKKFVTLFDQENMEQYHGLKDVAATMARKLVVQDRRDRCDGDAGRGYKDPYQERNDCLPSSSREVTPLKPKQSKETGETLDLLVNQIFLMASNNTNLPNSERDTFMVPRERGSQGDARSTDMNPVYSNFTDEEARARMLRKYKELQLEVERLNRSLRQFADDFLFSDCSRKTPAGTVRKKVLQSHRESNKR